MRIVVDMNLSPRWAVRLAELGHEAVHWSAVGDPRATDAAVMAWARGRGHAVLTHDLDFPEVVAVTGAPGPSVVLLRRISPDPGLLAALVDGAVREHEAALARGAVLVVEPNGARVRLLPVRR
jgi:predicted nuclease of predicted toxin-antitoxin system